MCRSRSGLEEALRSDTMPAVAAHKASVVLAEFGFGTALDLELLGGGEAAAELLAELEAHGLNPADMAKARLLSGVHKRRLQSAEGGQILGQSGRVLAAWHRPDIYSITISSSSSVRSRPNQLMQ